MPFSHGSKANFKVQDAGGVTRDISAYLTSITFPAEVDTAETSTLGTTDKTYVVGLRGHSVSMEGIFDPVVDGYLEGIKGFATARTFEYHPQGTGSGTPKYAGSLLETSYEVSSPIDDAGAFSAEMTVTGAVTRSLNP